MVDNDTNNDKYLHTYYHPSAILIHCNSCCLSLENMIPTEREGTTNGFGAGVQYIIYSTQCAEGMYCCQFCLYFKSHVFMLTLTNEIPLATTHSWGSLSPDHRIPTEEDIDTRLFVVIDLVAPDRPFPVAKDNNSRTQTTVYSVTLCKEEREEKSNF